MQLISLARRWGSNFCEKNGNLLDLLSLRFRECILSSFQTLLGPKQSPTKAPSSLSSYAICCNSLRRSVSKPVRKATQTYVVRVKTLTDGKSKECKNFGSEFLHHACSPSLSRKTILSLKNCRSFYVFYHFAAPRVPVFSDGAVATCARKAVT